MVSLEYKTYIACTAQLSKSMAPSLPDIAADLAGMGMIPPNLAEKIRSTTSGQASTSELVSSVAARISENRDRYHEFVDVLKRYPNMSDTLDLLFDTYDNGGVKLRGTGARPVSRRKTTAMRKDAKPVECTKPVDDKVRKTGKQLAREAVNSAIRRTRLQEAKTKGMHVVLALSVVLVSVLGGLTSFYISGGHKRGLPPTPPSTPAMKGQVCTKMDSPQALAQVLMDTGAPLDSLCKGLNLPDATCSSLAETPPLGRLAEKYMEKNPGTCWEGIVKILCHKLANGELAKSVAEKHGVADYSALC